MIHFITSFFIFWSSIAFSNNTKFDFPQGQLELLQSQNTLGLYFQLEPEWHIYWKNSGDSGATPIWNWNLEGAKIKKELWPAPQRIPVAGLMNIGYSENSLFLFHLDAEDQVNAKLDLEFLVCKVECIPYFAKLEKSFSVVTQDFNFENLQKKFNYVQDQIPSGLRFQIQTQYQNKLIAELKLPMKVKNLEIFPADGQSFQATEPQLNPDGDVISVTLGLQSNAKKDLLDSEFLIVADEKSYEVKLEKKEVQFLIILLWAFIGGMILNLMPCVLPVLSIKILSFAKHSQSAQELKVSGWLYTLGVLISFLVIGGTLLILRAGGEQIGWGFQLQSPLIASSLAMLFVWVGFNFLGTFEVGQSLAGVGSQNKGGAFFTGVLATVVATPCTAPFMGAALGASLALPSYQTIVIFLGLGFGMALPFLFLAYAPQALRFLPRPGQWMVTLKEFLAFPMFATVIWLLWVLSQQIETDSLLILILIFLFTGFWIWLSKKWKSEKNQQGSLLLGFVLSFLLVFNSPLNKIELQKESAVSNWQNFSPEKVKEDLKNNRSVFIDFTAAWCITCQVNKKAVLETEDIQKIFLDNNVSIYKADWTHRDPVITKALADFGRNSLPLYVFYQSGSDQALILPELLTKSMILNLFKQQQEDRSE